MADPTFSPHPRTESEWIAKGKTPEQARRKVTEDVFGVDYRTDTKGNPIEVGKGSAAQTTQQHREALDRNTRAERAYRASLGYHPGLEGAFDPRIAALEEENARLRAAAKRKPKPAKRKPAQAVAE